eukprot:TRINITY_DN13034_c0_g1_i2.p1 TRINITY_DN13034_c0_g1~~TRINITY_DN13034_c0_g1_i2.p1  ORF type:complete len:127 (-),score=0.70 TRINITY_DN13034_c0_g1_i2:712-1092(-)
MVLIGAMQKSHLHFQTFGYPQFYYNLVSKKGKPQHRVSLFEYMNVNEVESVWKIKPWWCQPYTIILSGLSGVGFFWLVTGGNLWITTPVAVLVALWWYLFLIVYPVQYKEYLQQMKRQDDMWNQQR